MVAAWLLYLLGWSSLYVGRLGTCYALTYDSLSHPAHLEMFPSTLRLGPGSTDYSNMAAVKDTAGKWGTPLWWNTYRVRGDSIEVWLADGNREIKIVGRVRGEALDGTAEVQTDEGGVRRTAHVSGQITQCSTR